MGDEGDMIKKMKVGQLQAVGVSTVGLHVVAPIRKTIDVPMMVSNRDEYRCALGKMAPKFEKALEAKGVVVLAGAKSALPASFRPNRARPWRRCGPRKCFHGKAIRTASRVEKRRF